jgi:hypothetical protein
LEAFPVVLSMIHWKVPTVTIVAFTAAVCFAVGHHLFYRNLDGTDVPTTNVFRYNGGAGVSPQRFNTSVGTAFAFLVKSALQLAVTGAYVQALWRSLKLKKLKISTVDSGFSVASNPLELLNWNVWRAFFTATLLAVLLWCVL